MEETTSFIPEIYIGENGNWYIGESGTQVPARGPKGDKGDRGPVGPVNIANNLETMEEGYALDTRQGEVLNSKLRFETKSLGSYEIVIKGQAAVNVAYTPPAGYTVVGFTLQLPPRYVAAIRFTGGTFNGVLYNVSNGTAKYSINALIILAKL